MIRGIVIPLLFLTLCLRFSPTCQPDTLNFVDSTYTQLRRQLSTVLKNADSKSSLTVTLCLLLAGDIEPNPGPRETYC